MLIVELIICNRKNRIIALNEDWQIALIISMKMKDSENERYIISLISIRKSQQNVCKG